MKQVGSSWSLGYTAKEQGSLREILAMGKEMLPVHLPA